MPDTLLKSAVPVVERKRRPPRRRKVLRWVKRVLLSAVAAAIVFAIVRAWLPEPLVVDVAAIARGPLEVEISDDGRTRVRERFVVSAPISGDLERIAFEPGSAVDAGVVLARVRPAQAALLDDRTRGEATARLTAAGLAERQATTAIARARLARDAAVREADRARRLEQQGAIAVAEREKAELAERLAAEDLATSELQRRSAQAEIAAARAVLSPSSDARSLAEVLAPVRGKVLRVLRESAGPVAAGTPLVELGDTASLEVVVDTLSSAAATITPGMEVRVSTDGASALAGRVRLVEPAAFTRVSALGVEEQRVNVIASIDRPPPSLGDGFRVDATIITWRGEGVTLVPASALFRDHGRWAVYVVVDGEARLRSIEIGHRGKLAVEVVRGLAVGERVIVHPSDRIADGVAVAPR